MGDTEVFFSEKKKILLKNHAAELLHHKTHYTLDKNGIRSLDQQAYAETLKKSFYIFL